MLTFLESLKKLKNSKEFKEFVKQNPNSYLSTGFIIYENENSNWQINYYCPKKDLFYNFIINKKISLQESKKFGKDKIKKLDLSKIKINFKQALELIKTKEKPEKIIAILQNSIWNIIYLTKSFKTINFKIDYSTKKIISSEEKSVFEFKKSR